MPALNLRSFLLAALLPAATVVQARAADLTVVRFQAVCFDPRESATPEFYIDGGKGERQLLELDKTRLSRTQEAPVRSGRMVDFFLAKDPQEGEKPAVTITLPESMAGKALLVFAPAESSYQGWAIPLPPGEFPPGGNLLVNVTPVELAIRAGDAKATVTVAPAKHRFLKAPASLKDDMMPIQIFQRSAAGDPWQIVQSTRWAVDSRFRSYVFFYQSANGLVMLHGISERLAASGADDD